MQISKKLKDITKHALFKYGVVAVLFFHTILTINYCFELRIPFLHHITNAYWISLFHQNWKMFAPHPCIDYIEIDILHNSKKANIPSKLNQLVQSKRFSSNHLLFRIYDELGRQLVNKSAPSKRVKENKQLWYTLYKVAGLRESRDVQLMLRHIQATQKGPKEIEKIQIPLD